MKNGIINPDECFFVLITTAELSVSSILNDFSKEERNFNVDKKLKYIIDIANEVLNRNGKKRGEDFLLLSKAEQLSIIKNLYIYGSSDNIEVVSRRIKNKLKHTVDDKYIDDVYHQLYGWWEERVEKHLLDKTKKNVITTKEVRVKKLEISEGYWRNNLSICLNELNPTQIEDTVNSKSTLKFIEQLKLIGFVEDSEDTLQAKKDYCRVFLQITKWIKNQEIFDDELSKYNRRLIEEWNENFRHMCSDLDSSCDIEYIKKKGRDLYWDTRKIRPHLKIRERCDEPFIQRGGYEILSDKLDVGWHKNYGMILGRCSK